MKKQASLRHRDYRWAKYREKMAKVASLKAQVQKHRSMLWRQKVVESGGLSSRHLWQSLKGPKEDLDMVITEQRTYTGEEEVLREMVNHFQEVGAEDERSAGIPRSQAQQEEYSTGEKRDELLEPITELEA